MKLVTLTKSTASLLWWCTRLKCDVQIVGADQTRWFAGALNKLEGVFPEDDQPLQGENWKFLFQLKQTKKQIEAGEKPQLDQATSEIVFDDHEFDILDKFRTKVERLPWLQSKEMQQNWQALDAAMDGAQPVEKAVAVKDDPAPKITPKGKLKTV